MGDNKFPEDTKVKFIKLGDSNKYAKECFDNGYARLGYDSVSHELCQRGQWDKVKNIFSTRPTKKTNNLKDFYEGSSETIWINFHRGNMWWTRLKENGTRKLKNQKTYFKVRDCVDEWSNRSINDKLLEEWRISGELLKVKNYRGTICEPAGKKEAIRIINDTVSEKVEAFNEARRNLKNNVEEVIGALNSDDFELLVDLIFRESGWKRRHQLGGTRENVDLDLRDPLSKKIVFAQVKCESTLNEYQKFVKSVENIEDYQADEYYFITSKPNKNLMNHNEEFVAVGDEETPVKIITIDEISEWIVDLGLTNWIAEKA